MRTPYSLDIIESCLSCKLREDRLFCDLPAEALRAFEAIKYTTVYPKGALLFVEGSLLVGYLSFAQGERSYRPVRAMARR